MYRVCEILWQDIRPRQGGGGEDLNIMHAAFMIWYLRDMTAILAGISELNHWKCETKVLWAKGRLVVTYSRLVLAVRKTLDENINCIHDWVRRFTPEFRRPDSQTKQKIYVTGGCTGNQHLANYIKSELEWKSRNNLELTFVVLADKG